MKGHAALTSSKSASWLTPPEIFEPLNEEFNFQLDPCTTDKNPLDLPHYYTPVENGLAQPWINTTFVNPPYNSEIPKWLAKALGERKVRGITSVLLLPARTDTRWFHDYLYDAKKNQPRPGVELRFLKGRVRFIDPETMLPGTFASTFPNVIAVIRPIKERVRLRV